MIFLKSSGFSVLEHDVSIFLRIIYIYTIMKSIARRIIAGIIDFYYLSFLVGLILIIIYIIAGAINANILIGLGIIIFLSTVIYHIFNKKFIFISPGETIIGIEEKSNKQLLNSKFNKTRLPLFIITIISLAFSGNLLDGLAKNGSYTIFNFLIILLIFNCLYRGIKGFMLQPNSLSLLVICSGLFLQFMIYKGKFMMINNVFAGLLILWIVAGILYLNFFLKEKEIAE